MKDEEVSTGAELIPGEVAARQEREGMFEPHMGGTALGAETKVANGYSVSGQGLINNHAITPPIYRSKKSLAEKRRDLTMVGILCFSIVGLALGTTIFISMTV